MELAGGRITSDHDADNADDPGPGGAATDAPTTGAPASDDLGPGGAGDDLGPGGAGDDLGPGGAATTDADTSEASGGAGDDLGPGGAGDDLGPGGAADTDADTAEAAGGAGPGGLPLAAAVGLVALGGVFGTASRYELELVWPAAAGTFPWATFAINISGAAVLGALLTLLTGRWHGRPAAVAARPLLTTGFLGAYTTWSTYMVETAVLAKDGAAGTAFAYLAASLVAGLVAAHAGIWAAGRVLPR